MPHHTAAHKRATQRKKQRQDTKLVNLAAGMRGLPARFPLADAASPVQGPALPPANPSPFPTLFDLNRDNVGRAAQGYLQGAQSVYGGLPSALGDIFGSRFRGESIDARAQEPPVPLEPFQGFGLGGITPAPATPVAPAVPPWSILPPGSQSPAGEPQTAYPVVGPGNWTTIRQQQGTVPPTLTGPAVGRRQEEDAVAFDALLRGPTGPGGPAGATRPPGSNLPPTPIAVGGAQIPRGGNRFDDEDPGWRARAIAANQGPDAVRATAVRQAAEAQGLNKWDALKGNVQRSWGPDSEKGRYSREVEAQAAESAGLGIQDFFDANTTTPQGANQLGQTHMSGLNPSFATAPGLFQGAYGYEHAQQGRSMDLHNAAKAKQDRQIQNSAALAGASDVATGFDPTNRFGAAHSPNAPWQPQVGGLPVPETYEQGIDQERRAAAVEQMRIANAQRTGAGTDPRPPGSVGSTTSATPTGSPSPQQASGAGGRPAPSEQEQLNDPLQQRFMDRQAQARAKLGLPPREGDRGRVSEEQRAEAKSRRFQVQAQAINRGGGKVSPVELAAMETFLKTGEIPQSFSEFVNPNAAVARMRGEEQAKKFDMAEREAERRDKENRVNWRITMEDYTGAQEEIDKPLSWEVNDADTVGPRSPVETLAAESRAMASISTAGRATVSPEDRDAYDLALETKDYATAYRLLVDNGASQRQLDAFAAMYGGRHHFLPGWNRPGYVGTPASGPLPDVAGAHPFMGLRDITKH